MNAIKKLVAILTTCLMIVTCLPATLFAYEAPSTDGAVLNIETVMVSVPYMEGQVQDADYGATLYVDVTITGNPGFASMGMDLNYNPEELRLVPESASAGDLCPGCVINTENPGYVRAVYAGTNDNTGDGKLFSVAFHTMKQADTVLSLNVDELGNTVPEDVPFTTSPVTIDIPGPQVTHQVTFISEGIVLDGYPVSVADGTVITPPYLEDTADATFTGWYPEGSDTPFSFDTPVTSDLTLTAGWNKTDYGHSVSFTGDEGVSAVYVYYTEPDFDGGMDFTEPDEQDAVTNGAVTRNAAGEPDSTETGRIFIQVIPNNGYSVIDVSGDEGAYINAENLDDMSEKDNVYRLTGITQDCTVKITTQAHQHTPGEPVQENVVNASCETPGSYDEVVYCTECQAEISRETKEILPLDHDWQISEEQPASCSAAGYVRYVCTRDASHTKEDILNQLDHIPGEPVRENVINPSCLEGGSYDEVVYCTECQGELSREHKTTEPNGHSPIGKSFITNPTCETPGKSGTIISCSVCEAVLEENFTDIPALNHKWDEGYVNKEPTEQEAGERIYTCLNDPTHIKKEVIPPLTHTHTPAEAVVENEVAGTCVTPGSYDWVIYCTECHAEISRETIPTTLGAHGELTTRPAKAATCEQDGSYGYSRCTVCGKLIDGAGNAVEDSADVIPALNHLPGEPQRMNEVPASCTQAGSYDEVIVCTREGCGKEISRKTVEVKATGHVPGQPERINEVKETCETPGSYTEIVKCTSCQGIINQKDVTVPPTGHKWKEAGTTPASCTQDGETRFVCENDASHTMSRVIKAHGHKNGTPVRENEVPASCTQEGSYDEVIYCTECKAEVHRVHKTIDKTKHVPDEAVVKENEVPATCETEGSYTEIVKCKDCQAEISRKEVKIPAKGHKWDEGKVTKEGSCTEDTETTFTCKNDPSHTKTEITTAKGHVWDIENAEIKVKASCTTDGMMTYKCKNCDEVHEEVIKAPGHTWDTYHHYCTTCGEEDPAFKPSIISGAGQEYDITKGGTIMFVSNDEFKNFDGTEFSGKVLIDNTQLKASDFVAKSGSIEVTLNEAVLKNLSVGQHNIRIMSKAGTAKAQFSVKKTASADTPSTGTNTGDNSGQNSGQNSGTNGNSGNNGNRETNSGTNSNSGNGQNGGSSQGIDTSQSTNSGSNGTNGRTPVTPQPQGTNNGTANGNTAQNQNAQTTQNANNAGQGQQNGQQTAQPTTQPVTQPAAQQTANGQQQNGQPQTNAAGVPVNSGKVDPVHAAKTGDENNMGLWIFLGAALLVSAGIGACVAKKKSGNEE